jgi:hypothetical protein
MFKESESLTVCLIKDDAFQGGFIRLWIMHTQNRSHLSKRELRSAWVGFLVDWLCEAKRLFSENQPIVNKNSFLF